MGIESTNTRQLVEEGHVYEVHKWAVENHISGNQAAFDHARIRPYLCCDALWTDGSWAGFSRSHGKPPKGFTPGKDCVISSKNSNSKFTKDGYWSPRYAYAISTVLINHLGSKIQHSIADDGPLQEDELMKVMQLWKVVCSYHFQEEDPYEPR